MPLSATLSVFHLLDTFSEIFLRVTFSISLLLPTQPLGREPLEVIEKTGYIQVSTIILLLKCKCHSGKDKLGEIYRKQHEL